jgi:hypothetical protein
MVFVMYGIVLLVVFLAVTLAATKDARIARQSLSEITQASTVPILATSQTVRLDKERVQNNV